LGSWFIVASRFTIAGIITGLMTRKKWHLIDKDYIIGGLWIGGTVAIGTWLQVAAMVLGTSPGKSAFLTAAYCVMVPFLAWIVMKERPRKNHLAAAVICLIGIGLISLNGSGGMTLGDGMTLLCSVMFGINLICISKYSRGRDPMLLTMLQIVVCAAFGWVGLIFEGMPETISMNAAGNILYLAVFSTAAALSFQTFGLKHTNPTVATIVLSLESVFGVLFSVLLYGETITLRMGIGFAVVFAAVILSELELTPKKDRIS
ncbi:MAG: DMT family transporter, partial [Anaerotignum sp.]|nr:DMT family transporter [Anaerotignum sp.]